MNVHAVPVAGDVQEPVPRTAERIVFAPDDATDADVIDYAVVVSIPVIPGRRLAPLDKVLPTPAT